MIILPDLFMHLTESSKPPHKVTVASMGCTLSLFVYYHPYQYVLWTKLIERMLSFEAISTFGGARGFLHTSQIKISHLLLYPLFWLLVAGLSSQFLPLFPIQPAFNVSSSHQDLREMATRFCKLWELLRWVPFLPFLS